MGKKLTPEVAAKLKRIKRASRLRAKVEKGTATDQERAELAALPALKRGRPTKVTQERQERQADVQAPEPPDGEAKPPPPPPPRVEVLGVGTSSGSAGGDWRKQYRQSVGREGACVQVASVYCSLLKRLSTYIESQGSAPILSHEAIDQVVMPAAVLTADKLLPDIDIGPEMELAIGSGLILGQAAIIAMRKGKTKKATPASPPMPGTPEPQQQEEQSPPPPPNGNWVRPMDENDLAELKHRRW